MAKYFAYLEQGGEGCDYTIGCGQELIELDAHSMKGAIKEMEGLVSHYQLERKLESACIYKVTAEHDFDVEKAYQSLDAQFAQKQAEKERAEELKTLAKLKAKYEGK